MAIRDRIAKVAQGQLERHRRKCKVCHHPKRREIEEDYLRCLPYAEITKERGVSYDSLVNHGIMTGLWHKRDRKGFYWRLIENCDLKKITCENALEAAKQLDRLEHKIDDRSAPSQITVVYSWGQKLKTNPDTKD